jgi:hypothetical protein
LLSYSRVHYKASDKKIIYIYTSVFVQLVGKDGVI